VAGANHKESRGPSLASNGENIVRCFSNSSVVNQQVNPLTVPAKMLCACEMAQFLTVALAYGSTLHLLIAYAHHVHLLSHCPAPIAWDTGHHPVFEAPQGVQVSHGGMFSTGGVGHLSVGGTASSVGVPSP
jgi:hypothetical protein